jgi:hypothetical protein
MSESVAAKLLAKHTKRPPTRCMSCREPYRAALLELLNCAIKSQEVVTLGQIHGALVEYTQYPNGESALAVHLKHHDSEHYKQLNLARRGPVG